MRTSIRFSGLAAALAATLAGCAGDPSIDPSTADAVWVDGAFIEDLGTELEWLDLRPDDAVFAFEAGLTWDHYLRLGLMLDDHQLVTMTTWISAQRAALGRDDFPAGRWAVGTDPAFVEAIDARYADGYSPCAHRCVTRPDGTVACEWEAQCTVDGRDPEPAPTNDDGTTLREAGEDLPPGDFTPDSPRPDETPSGSGGRDGSGSGSGDGSGSAGQPGV